MRVKCEVEECDLEGEGEWNGEPRTVDGICVTCSQCQHQVEVYGTSGRSVRR